MLDLKEAYGKQYKIFMDESWEHMNPKKEEDKPWYYEIKGKYGSIYPYDEATLSVMATSSNIKERLRRNFKGRVTTLWDGDSEGVFLFDPKLTHEIATAIKARRRRQLSPEQRKKLVEAGGKNTGLNMGIRASLRRKFER